MTSIPIPLPENLSTRSATQADAPAIAALVIASEIAETGQAQTVPTDLLELWQDTATDLAADTCVVLSRSNTIIGYTGLAYRGHGFMLDPHTQIHSAYQQLGLEHYLHQFVEQRAQAHLVQRPDLAPHIYTPSFSPAWTTLLQQEGYTITSSEIRMQILLSAPPPIPQPIPGITIRPYLPGKEEPAIHTVVQIAFQDIGGHPYRPFADWEAGVLKRSGFDPSMLYVALADHTIVGAIICRSYPAEHNGHISQVAIHYPWRRHGIALQLLYTVFHAYYKRGISSITLDVDTHNPTGAYQLYEHAGMRKTTQVDNLQKTL